MTCVPPCLKGMFGAWPKETVKSRPPKRRLVKGRLVNAAEPSVVCFGRIRWRLKEGSVITKACWRSVVVLHT
jgi:hypothetical protein